MVELDDNIRSAVQTLVADAPEPPSWEFVQATKARLRRRRNVTIGAVVVVLLLAGVAVAGRVADNDQTVVAGPGEEELPCEGWVAVHTLFDSSANAQSAQSLLPTVTADQAAFLVKSGDVPDRVASRLGENPGELAAHVVARSNSDLGTIEITAWAEDPARARQLADAFAESLLASVSDIQQREIDRRRDVLNAQILQLEAAGLDNTHQRNERQELDQQAAQGSNIYTFRSSEAFFITGDQLAVLFDPAPVVPTPRGTTRALGPVREAEPRPDC